MPGHTRWEHILRARRLTPERYELVMRALQKFVDDCQDFEAVGVRCGQCGFEIAHGNNVSHTKDCIIRQVETLLKELEQEEEEAQQRRVALKEIARTGQWNSALKGETGDDIPPGE